MPFINIRVDLVDIVDALPQAITELSALQSALSCLLAAADENIRLQRENDDYKFLLAFILQLPNYILYDISKGTGPEDGIQYIKLDDIKDLIEAKDYQPPAETRQA